MKRITVIGSISTDFFATAPRFPQKGETITGFSFDTGFGGKGANQAIAISKLGGTVSMIGAVGSDRFAEALINNLTENGVDTDNVERVTDINSGSALITLAEQDNNIIYIPGANNKVSEKIIHSSKKIILESDLIVIQNEIPEKTVEYVINLCQKAGVPILLNPAPARKIDRALIDQVTYLTPNETECEVLFPNKDIKSVLKEYPNKLIVTLGSEGVIYHNGDSIVKVDPIEPKEIVDTTGAGDTFNGALSIAIVNDFSLEQAIKFANLAASISIEKLGAQTGSPTLSVMKERNTYEKTWDFK